MAIIHPSAAGPKRTDLSLTPNSRLNSSQVRFTSFFNLRTRSDVRGLGQSPSGLLLMEDTVLDDRMAGI